MLNYENEVLSHKDALDKSRAETLASEKEWKERIEYLESRIGEISRQLKECENNHERAKDSEEGLKLKISQLNQRLFASQNRVREVETVAAKYYGFVESRRELDNNTLFNAGIFERPPNQLTIEFDSNNQRQQELVAKLVNLEQKFAAMDAAFINEKTSWERKISILESTQLEYQENSSLQSESIVMLTSKLSTAQKIINLLHVQMK